MCHQKVYRYLNSDDHDEALSTYVTTINKQTSVKKPTSKLRLFKK